MTDVIIGVDPHRWVEVRCGQVRRMRPQRHAHGERYRYWWGAPDAGFVIRLVMLRGYQDGSG
jgi:hypothetical protein